MTKRVTWCCSGVNRVISKWAKLFFDVGELMCGKSIDHIRSLVTSNSLTIASNHHSVLLELILFKSADRQRNADGSVLFLDT